MHNNKLKEIPKTISNWRELRDLDLHKNKLEKLPKEIGTLSSLSRLTLYNNKLKSIPKELGNLKKLEKLKMHGNKLTLKSMPQSVLNHPAFPPLFRVHNKSGEYLSNFN